nr:hypothetical protein [Neobacillus notoginsengisoli]
MDKEITFLPNGEDEMTKEKQKRFEYDEKGTETVSMQIMNSYNSGFMGEQEAKEKRDKYPMAEGEIGKES